MDLKTHAWLALVLISLVTASDSYSAKPASHKIKQRLSPKLVYVSSGITPKTPQTPMPKSSPATPKTPPATISTPKPTTPSMGTCPRDALKLGLCANLLGGLAGVAKGTPNTPCCSLLQGLADLDAAVCLCTAIKANLLGNDLDVPISFSVLLSACNYKVPSGYKCAD